MLSSHKHSARLGDHSCVDCCALRVLSAHPRKDLANAHIVAMTRFHDTPGRKAILARVAEMMGKE